MTTPGKLIKNYDLDSTKIEKSVHLQIHTPHTPTTHTPSKVSKVINLNKELTTNTILKKWKSKIITTPKPHHHGLYARYASPGNLKMSALKSFLIGVFTTRELAPNDDRDLYIRYTVREIAVYTVYLFVIGMITLGLGLSTPFMFTQMLENLFLEEPIGPGNPKNLKTSASVEDFWSYARNVIPNVLYSEYIYSKQWPVVKLPNPEKSGILYENQLVGLPRLRQLRVKSDNCPVADNFRHLTRECYPTYREKFEDTGDKNKKNYWNGGGGKYSTAWQYKTSSELNGSKHNGVFTTYNGGGAVITLAKREKGTVEIIQSLYNREWVNRGTRVVFFDFTVYNANVNYFCIVRIVWEFPATGGVTPSWTFRSLRLIKYLTWFEVYVVFPCQILFCIFTIYYFIQEILEIKHFSYKEYLKDFYNYLDWIILLISFYIIVLTIIQYIRLLHTMKNLTNELNEFYDFENIGYWETHLNHSVAFLVFFVWVKVYKYISFNKTMIQLSATLSRCSKDVSGFVVMFFIVFFAFAQLGYLFFGAQLKDFKTFEESVFTLLRLILGEFDFRRTEAVSRVIGPIYVLSYLFFIFFVLLNMFLAILTDTYSEVKAEIQGQRNEFEISDYINRSFNNFIGLFGKRNVHKDAEDAVKLAPVDGHLTYTEINKSLQRANFTEIEIKIYLRQFGLKPEGSLDEEDTQQILNKLEEINQKQNQNQNQDNIKIRKTAKANMKQGDITREKYKRMQIRLMNLEIGLTELLHKIILLTEKFEK